MRLQVLLCPSVVRRCRAACGVCRRRKEKGLEDEDVEAPLQGARVAPLNPQAYPAAQQPLDGSASPGWPSSDAAKGAGGAATERSRIGGSATPSSLASESVRPVRAMGNGQDADDSSLPFEVPPWQMPQLVVECARRPGARIHKGTSLILPDAGGDLIAGIVAHLPVMQQLHPCWQLGYSMAVDGVSLRTLFRQVHEVGACLLVVEDSNCCIFGAFASEGLRSGNRCHGTHETFLFRYPRAGGAWRTEIFLWSPPKPQPEEVAPPLPPQEQPPGYNGPHAVQFEVLQKASPWSSPATLYCDHMGIVVGIDGPAIFIDQDLLRGVSCPSKAYGSPCMAAAGPDFVVRNLEVWHWVAS